MTFKFNNVYVNGTSTVTGPYEKRGPLGNKFDKSYDDLYTGEKSWEKAEVKLLEESIDILLNKIGVFTFVNHIFTINNSWIYNK